jgi:hypothetical protein
MKKLLLNLSLLLLGVATGFSQQQEFAFQQWAGSSGTQNFFYKNITKTDASQNIYTAGATLNGSGNYDLLLVKYNKSGVVQWTKQYDGAGNGADMATGIHIDGSGNVYVTGTTYVNGTNYNDILTIKYNSSGTQQWLSTYNGSGSSYDAGGAIIVNAAGNTVFICGGAMTTSNLSDFITVSYNASTGAQNWASTYNYNGNYDVAAKIALTGLNQTTVVVSGGVQHNSTTWKYATMNYSGSTGNMLGSPSVSGNNTGSLAELGDICEDATQTYTYVAGSVNNTGTGTGYDYKIAKLLNSNLSVVWERTWNGANSLDDKAADIVVDASGNVYVTGFTTTTTQGKNYATVKYNSSGTLQWTKYHNGAGNGIDEATAINLDASNNVYVTGTSHTGGSQDYYTIKYKPDNTVVWEQAYNGLFNGLDKAYDIAVNPSTNEIAVSGQTQTSTGYSYTTVSIGQATTVTNPNEVFNSSFSFTHNLGQLLKSNGTSASNIKYYNFSNSPSTYFSDTAVSYVLSSIDTLPATNDTLHRVDRTYTGHKTPGQYGINKRSDYYNFYLAHIPEGRAHVTNYNRLITPELYNKIDVLYTGNGKGLVTTFVCKPTSTPAASIKMKFAGADSIRVVNNDLIIYTKLGQIKHPRATAYELDNNGTSYVLGWFPTYVRSGNEITFTLGTYNTSRNLIIDMGFGTETAMGGGGDNLDWSTYYGGGDWEDLTDLTTDNIGNIYIAGETLSEDFPTVSGSFIDNYSFNNGYDAFAVKFDSSAVRQFATYFGGNDYEGHNEIDVDINYNIFLTGTTNSVDLPFPSNPPSGAYLDTVLNGTDIYVCKLNPGGTNLLWNTFYGGTGNEYGGDIVIDENNNIYVQTNCDSNTPRFVQAGAFNDSLTGNILLLKFNSQLQRTWATRFGATAGRAGRQSLAKDENNHLFVTGMVDSTGTNFPLINTLTGAYYDSIQSNSDMFISRFNTSDNLIWSTYYGGSNFDYANDICTYGGNTYVVGHTFSTNFPLFQPGSQAFMDSTYNGNYDVVIVRFKDSGERTWSTYYSGSGYEAVPVVDATTSNVYITFPCASGDIDTQDRNAYNYYFQNSSGGNSDAFIAQFSISAELLWGTFFGGLKLEVPLGISSYNDNKLYIAGTVETENTDNPPFPTMQLPNPLSWFQGNLNQNPGNLYDGFITRFSTQSIAVSIEENITAENENKLFVFPNPAQTQITLLLNELNGQADIKLYNSLGQLIFNETYTEKAIPINIQALSEGIYYVYVKTKDFEGSLKFIKAK